jgi:PBP1b-binding outer membrane lipoprotein LpoB
MFRGFWKAAALIIALSFLFAACAKPPTEEMNNAVSAVTRAENDADAVTYAGNTLLRARDAINRMQTEAEAKRYDAAKTYAAEAVNAAEKAIADGRTGASRAREEAAALIGDLRTSITETEAAAGAARQVKNIQLDFNLINQDLDAAKRTTDQAEVSLAGSNYNDARDKARVVRGILGDVNSRIAAAGTAAGRKK